MKNDIKLFAGGGSVASKQSGGAVELKQSKGSVILISVQGEVVVALAYEFDFSKAENSMYIATF